MQGDMTKRSISFIFGLELKVRRTAGIDDVLRKAFAGAIATQQGILTDGLGHDVERLKHLEHLRDIAAIAGFHR